ncbi:MAG: NUDIX hydrolase [Candidatus Acidiferrales bacterium]
MSRSRRLPVVGVGGVVIRDGHVLLARRARAPLEGQWSIPGGHVEWGETLEQAVVRELREETALHVRVLELLEIVERIGDDPAGDSAAESSVAPTSEERRLTPMQVAVPEVRGLFAPQHHHIIHDYLCEAAAGDAQPAGDAAELAWAAEIDLARFHLTAAATRVIRKAFARTRVP